MAKKTFEVNKRQRPIDVTDEAEITPDEVKRINAKFIRQYGRRYPLLAGLLQAAIADDNSPPGPAT